MEYISVRCRVTIELHQEINGSHELFLPEYLDKLTTDLSSSGVTPDEKHQVIGLFRWMMANDPHICSTIHLLGESIYIDGRSTKKRVLMAGTRVVKIIPGLLPNSGSVTGSARYGIDKIDNDEHSGAEAVWEFRFSELTFKKIPAEGAQILSSRGNIPIVPPVFRGIENQYEVPIPPQPSSKQVPKPEKKKDASSSSK
ncbi:TPA_asm: M [Pentaphragma betacytorhabdovirus 1]|nr:TPA_asm: M [Pentaphragma betacytorhabdovirus 1]